MIAKKYIKSQTGFTIVELLIATSIFSVILLMASSGIVQLGRLYYKGVTEAKTQETARAVVDDITGSIQFSKSIKVVGPTTPTSQSFCIGDVRYTYSINQKVDPATAKSGLIVQKLGGQACSAAVADPGKELLSKNMRLLKFSVNPEQYDPRSYNVVVRIAFGDNDLLSVYPDDAIDTTPPTSPVDNAICKSGKPGGSFCATTELDTIVKKRLN